jgi:Ca2+-binding EF-hand superfamily protein
VENIFYKTDGDDDGFITAEDFYSVLTHKGY